MYVRTSAVFEKQIESLLNDPNEDIRKGAAYLLRILEQIQDNIPHDIILKTDLTSDSDFDLKHLAQLNRALKVIDSDGYGVKLYRLKPLLQGTKQQDSILRASCILIKLKEEGNEITALGVLTVYRKDEKDDPHSPRSTNGIAITSALPEFSCRHHFMLCR